jgi:hypothetical protein
MSYLTDKAHLNGKFVHEVLIIFSQLKFHQNQTSGKQLKDLTSKQTEDMDW